MSTFNITYDYLYDNYVVRQKRITQIAKELGCCRTTVLNKIRFFGIREREPKNADLRERRFGKWLVEGITVNGKCPCVCDCGTHKEVYAQSLLLGLTTRCKRCHYKDNVCAGAGDITGVWWNKVKHQALRRNLAFNVGVDEAWRLFQSQDGICALTGLPLSFKKGDTSASLDRIDSARGYELSNLQWVHKTVNKMKTNLPQEEFIAFCLLIAKHADK